MGTTIITITIIITGLVGALGKSNKNPKTHKVIEWMKNEKQGCYLFDL